MLKAIILTPEERSEIDTKYASNDIYQYVGVISDDISSKCNSFYLRKEELFYEIISVVDTIRENDTTKEAANYAMTAYKKLFNKYRSRINDTQQDDVLSDLHLNTAAVIYTAASLLTLSSAPKTVQYIPTLIESIEGDPTNVPYLMRLSRTTMVRNLSDNAIKEWTKYYMSDNFIIDEMNELIQKIRDFNYINVTTIAYLSSGLTLTQFMQELKDAVRGEAKVLIPFLKRYNDMDVLNFHNDGLKTIFTKLRNRFPEMRQYEYPNFEKYAKKENFSPH